MIVSSIHASAVAYIRSKHWPTCGHALLPYSPLNTLSKLQSMLVVLLLAEFSFTHLDT